MDTALPSANKSKNNYLFVLVIIAVLVGAGYYYFTNKTKAQAEVVVLNSESIVKMGSDAYVPQNFTVKKGAKITFLNESDGLRWPASDLHPSHLIYPAFDPKAPISKGEKWVMTFDKVGEWGYHDHLAPYITGTIKVIE